MLSEEEKDQASRGSWKTFSRSLTWTERPPKKSNSKTKWNSKARACLPPLQPLSIIRPSIEEWPRAGSDDLGVWPNPLTPGARSSSVTPRESSTSDQPPIEFEFRRDKLAFFDKECSRILDHIYLGSDAIAKNRETLRQNGITHVLNCVGFVCPEYFKNELVYKTLWLQDSPSEDITSILYDVFDYFEDVREQNGRVLVHCCQGVSRSTSLVIAYLMWKEGQSFDNAFQLVKAARGVTNPNVGFACQLLQCQKRVHALPASPTSLLRMYRLAPHSPYDPLHLVPKMLCVPGSDKFDSRGAFIVHIPSALYVWIGKHCSPMMSENARASASQIFRYESTKCPVFTVKEGGETFEFWDALGYKKSLVDSSSVKFEDEIRLSSGSHVVPGRRKIDEYDLDFEIYNRALAGGVVPPFPLSGGSETCLPARENGWNRLRRKFANGIMKEFITSSKLKSMSICGKVEDVVSTNLPNKCDSTDSFETNLKDTRLSDFSDTSIPRSPSFSLVDSFSSFIVIKPKSNSTSPSISPSNSDYSSSFTFSPSSSNWSDLSFVSTQPSPCGLESKDANPCKSCHLEESAGSVDESSCLLNNVISHSSEEVISAGHNSLTILPSIDEASQISEKLTRYLEDDDMTDIESNNLSREVSFELDGEEPISDANSYTGDDDDLISLQDKRPCDLMTNKVAEVANLLFYEWPSMHKMDMRRDTLDSKFIYIILLPAINFGTQNADVCWVWIGNGSKCKDSYAHLKKVGHDLLIEKSISSDVEVKIVKEGEEPVELLQHLACFSLRKDLDDGDQVNVI